MSIAEIEKHLATLEASTSQEIRAIHTVLSHIMKRLPAEVPTKKPSRKAAAPVAIVPDSPPVVEETDDSEDEFDTDEDDETDA